MGETSVSQNARRMSTARRRRRGNDTQRVGGGSSPSRGVVSLRACLQAGEAIPCGLPVSEGDCFVASLLAMTQNGLAGVPRPPEMSCDGEPAFRQAKQSPAACGRWRGLLRHCVPRNDTRARGIASSLRSSQGHGMRRGLLRRCAPRNDTKRLGGGYSPSRGVVSLRACLQAGEAIPCGPR